jgi:hypothetical protein
LSEGWQHSGAGRAVRRGAGLGLVAGAIACGGLGWLILRLVAPIAADPPYPPEEIPAFARGMVEMPALMPLLSLPALVCGVVMLKRKMKRGWIPALVGSTLLLVPFLIALMTFVLLIAPMYTYRAL